MSFGLKNAGATYQRTMSTMFRDHLQKMVECYVDDVAVKSRSKSKPSHRLENRVQYHVTLPTEDETKSFLGVSEW